jgi:hypothetical protein
VVREGVLRNAPRRSDRDRPRARREADVAIDREAGEGRGGRRLPSRSIPRRARGTGFAASAAAASIALALLLTACGSAPPTLSTRPATPPPSSPTPSGGSIVDDLLPCPTDGLEAEIAAWDGAAGSRIARIEVTNGDAACVLEGPPSAALLDGAGAILLASNGPVGGADDVDAAAGGRIELYVSVGNWCDQPPRPPVSIGLTLPDGARLVAPPAAGVSFVPPPCNGPGQPATMSVQSESWTVPGP